jgi:PBP1b-binding outer membrane lipoprotein LpoB
MKLLSTLILSTFLFVGCASKESTEASKTEAPVAASENLSESSVAKPAKPSSQKANKKSKSDIKK